ncbi:MAG: hypothetical protein WC655_24465, partial [Candidatus Hydrogenedentales bacterium]
MSVVTWTLEIAGEVRSFEAWGASVPVGTFRSMDEDTVEFVITGDITTDCAAAYGNSIRIFRIVDSGTPLCWFVGTVTSVTAFGTMQVMQWTVRCANFWFQYSRTMFQQTNTCYSEACAKVTNISTTKVVLFQDTRTGWAITTGEQIQAIVDYATTLGLPVGLGTRPDFVSATFEPARDLTLADAIRRCMQFTPDGVSWVDYSSGAAVLNFQQRTLLSAVTLNATADPQVINRVELRRRDDLVPAGVRFNYIGFVSCQAKVPELCVDDTDGTTNTTGGVVTASESDQLVAITQDSAGLPDLPGGLVGTFDLAQMSGTATETAPVGLALDYYTSLVTPQWEGEIAITEQECSGSVRPGKIVNISNGHSSWVTMNAMVQQVTENMDTGESTISVGIQSHLGQMDFAALVAMTRRRPIVQDAFAATRAPGPENTNCYGGKEPKAQQML